MIHIDLAEAMSGLDDELLDEYLTQRTAYRRRLDRRRALRKRLAVAAACLLAILSVTAKIGFDCRYPYIPLENAVGDVSVRYVPEWMVEGSYNDYLPSYSEDDLFSKSDCIFTGSVQKINYIKLYFSNQTLFRTIVSIDVDRYYKGNGPSTIRMILSTPSKDPSAPISLLHILQNGDYGVFFTSKLSESQKMIHNNSSLLYSDIADVSCIDNYGFAILKDTTTDGCICYDTFHLHPTKLFATLNTDDWTLIHEYLDSMLSANRSYT